MRSVFALATALTFGAAFPAFAEELPIQQEPPAQQEAKPLAEEKVGSRLDELFSELKRERNEKAAERIAGASGRNGTIPAAPRST